MVSIKKLTSYNMFNKPKKDLILNLDSDAFGSCVNNTIQRYKENNGNDTELGWDLKDGFPFTIIKKVFERSVNQDNIKHAEYLVKNMVLNSQMKFKLDNDTSFIVMYVEYFVYRSSKKLTHKTCAFYVINNTTKQIERKSIGVSRNEVWFILNRMVNIISTEPNSNIKEDEY